MTPGEKLKDWRTGNKLSQKELAARLVNPRSGKAPHMSLIWCWETGKSPVPAWALEQISHLDKSLDVPGEKVKPGPKPKHNPFRDFKISKHPPTKDKFARKSETKALNPETKEEDTMHKGGADGLSHVVIEFGPEAKAFLGALIKAIVVDPEDIRDPVVRGFLKQAEGR